MASSKEIRNLLGDTHDEWLVMLNDLVERCGGVVSFTNALFQIFNNDIDGSNYITKYQRWLSLVAGKKIPQFHETMIVIMLHQRFFDDGKFIIGRLSQGCTDKLDEFIGTFEA